MIILAEGKLSNIGRRVRNTNSNSVRWSWVGTIVDEDDSFFLVQYDNHPERKHRSRGSWPYTLQLYMKGRNQRLQRLGKNYG